MDRQNQILLSLVRAGIGHECEPIAEPIDWPMVKEAAKLQGMLAIALDGIQAMVDRGLLTIADDDDFMAEWITAVMLGYGRKYPDYRKRIGQLARFYTDHGFKMMVLKGYGVGLNYPCPEHRPCGDIDTWMFGRYQEADAVLSKELGIPVDSSHHHHTVFTYKGYTVENHYDFVNVHAHRSSREIEKIFKRLGTDDTHFTEIDGARVYLPSANLHALFLLRHMVSHFASTSITLRQVLDWAFLTEKQGREIDWPWLTETLDAFHMREFFDCINAVCVEDLGFASSIFPERHCPLALKSRVLQDILSPEFSDEQPAGFLPRVIFKFRRWRANGWKQRMCYPEGRLQTFLGGVWNHILKPSGI